MSLFKIMSDSKVTESNSDINAHGSRQSSTNINPSYRPSPLPRRGASVKNNSERTGSPTPKPRNKAQSLPKNVTVTVPVEVNPLDMENEIKTAVKWHTQRDLNQNSSGSIPVHESPRQSIKDRAKLISQQLSQPKIGGMYQSPAKRESDTINARKSHESSREAAAHSRQTAGCFGNLPSNSKKEAVFTPKTPCVDGGHNRSRGVYVSAAETMYTLPVYDHHAIVSHKITESDMGVVSKIERTKGHIEFGNQTPPHKQCTCAQGHNTRSYYENIQQLGPDSRAYEREIARLQNREQIALKETMQTIVRLSKKLYVEKKENTDQVPKVPLKSYDIKILHRFALLPHQTMLFDKQVGKGAYGCVYAVCLDGTPCIAKRLHDVLLGRGIEEAISLEEKQACHSKFVHECMLMSQTKHPNIVKFIGVVFGRDKFDLTLIMERLHTDLHQHLCGTSNIPLSTKVAILHDISCGLRYLHNECSIIHRDLTATNVLLTINNKAKIADLGVSRIVSEGIKQLTKLPGTLAYMPPEALKDKPVYNERLDIFSFGVLTLFVATQHFPELFWEHIPDSVISGGEGELYKRNKWLRIMEQVQPELDSLVIWCLADDASCRPSSTCLNIVVEEMKNYILLCHTATKISVKD